ncbi:MAG: cytochrome c biogenesis protein CcsA [Anaerolineae bacterium]|jgi:heme exporter protein C|nr:cytochrome c biogenesis protein CcsA [Anaerolineae bacterium]
MSAVQGLPVYQPQEAGAGESRTRLLQGYSVATLLLLTLSLGLMLAYAGQDVQQGEVQRLFYVHIASFFGAFFSFGAAVLAGIQYLRTRAARWDTLALAGIEVGLLLAFINLATGSIWARPIWNTWWTWDPRLTSAAVMFLTYVAYLMLRNGIDNPERRRLFASIYGILAFGTVVFTLVIIRIRPDTIHPTVIATQLSTSGSEAEGAFEMSSRMTQTLLFTLAVWIFFVTPALMWWRIRLENAAERLHRLKAQYLEE